MILLYLLRLFLQIVSRQQDSIQPGRDTICQENTRLDEILQKGPNLDEEKPVKKSQADKLVELVSNSGVTLFKDQYGEPCAKVFVKDHFARYHSNR